MKIDTKIDRAEYLKTIAPNDRSEAAARYDAQAEAEKLTSGADPEGWETVEAVDRLRAGAISEFINNSGYNKSYVYKRLSGRGILPDHISAALNAVADGVTLTEEQIRAAVELQRMERLEYLRRRYGVSA